MKKWSRGEKIASYALIVTVIGIIAALFNPEFRQAMGLISEPKATQAKTTKAFIVSTSPKFKVERITQSPDENVYNITLPNGGWFDTGIWVQSNIHVTNVIQSVLFKSSSGEQKQPFAILVGEREFESEISMEGDVFNAGFHLVASIDKVKGDYDIYLSEPQKIYIKARDGAVGETFSITASINQWIVRE